MLICVGFQSEASVAISTVFVCYLPPSSGGVSGVPLSSTLLEMGYVCDSVNKNIIIKNPSNGPVILRIYAF
jgi:hypothetical protein